MTPSQRTHLYSDVCKRKPTLHLKPMAPENRENDRLQQNGKTLLEIASIAGLCISIAVWSFV